MSAAQMKLCPSCAGQLKSDAASCPWCGAGLMATEATRVAAAPPPPVSSTIGPGVGLGEANKELPPLPPPPKSRPITYLNPTQVFLRAVILLGSIFLLFVFGRMLVEQYAYSVCNSPLPIARPKFCP